MNLAINIDKYGQYEVRIPVSQTVAFGTYLRLLQSPSFRLFDADPPEQYEPGIGGWANFYGPRPDLPHVGVTFDEDGSFVVVAGDVHPEGDDRLDGSFVPTELSLDDRLAVASVVKELVL